MTPSSRGFESRQPSQKECKHQRCLHSFLLSKNLAGFERPLRKCPSGTFLGRGVSAGQIKSQPTRASIRCRMADVPPAQPRVKSVPDGTSSRLTARPLSLMGRFFLFACKRAHNASAALTTFCDEQNSRDPVYKGWKCLFGRLFSYRKTEKRNPYGEHI